MRERGRYEERLRGAGEGGEGMLRSGRVGMSVSGVAYGFGEGIGVRCTTRCRVLPLWRGGRGLNFCGREARGFWLSLSGALNSFFLGAGFDVVV